MASTMAETLAASLPAPAPAQATNIVPLAEKIPASMSKLIDIEAEIPIERVQLDGLVATVSFSNSRALMGSNGRLYQKLSSTAKSWVEMLQDFSWGLIWMERLRCPIVLRFRQERQTGTKNGKRGVLGINRLCCER